MYDHSGPNQYVLMTKVAVRKTLPLGAAHTYLCSPYKRVPYPLLWFQKLDLLLLP